MKLIERYLYQVEKYLPKSTRKEIRHHFKGCMVY
jgi:hypothetical protein